MKTFKQFVLEKYAPKNPHHRGKYSAFRRFTKYTPKHLTFVPDVHTTSGDLATAQIERLRKSGGSTKCTPRLISHIITKIGIDLWGMQDGDIKKLGRGKDTTAKNSFHDYEVFVKKQRDNKNNPIFIVSGKKRTK